MRTEQEMLSLILGFAENNEHIRGVIMNGSRADKSVQKDKYQDFDICYIVDDVRLFTKDHSWIDVFGTRVIMQMPEDFIDQNYDYSSQKRFAYLMQFCDGNRIDLSIMKEYVDDSEPAVILMDKDNCLTVNPVDTVYAAKVPSEREYLECCNEFWWVSPYVIKGVRREELPIAQYMLNVPVKDMLMQMLSWYVLIEHGNVGIGKCGRHLERLLPPALTHKLSQTYANADYNNIYNALLASCSLFAEISLAVSQHFSFTYPAEYERNVTMYITSKQ